MLKRVLDFLKSVVNRTVVVAGGVAFTLIFFLVLPLLQQITAMNDSDLLVRSIDTAVLQPPPPIIEDEPEEDEPEEEEEPPELLEDTPPLDLSQLEMALNPGFGDGYGAAAMKIDLTAAMGGRKSLGDLVSSADLDEKPTPIMQDPPTLTPEVRRKSPGKVYVIFVVDERGRVQDARVQTPGQADSVLERAALGAVKRWRFEPGRRDGQPVRFRMRVPITFPRIS